MGLFQLLYTILCNKLHNVSARYNCYRFQVKIITIIHPNLLIYDI